MSSQSLTWITPEEYLAAERQAEYKNEYFAGEVFAMTGASREHNLISTNCTIAVGQQLRGRASSTTSDSRAGSGCFRMRGRWTKRWNWRRPGAGWIFAKFTTGCSEDQENVESMGIADRPDAGNPSMWGRAARV
jgi:hypothetical protein